MRLDDLGRVATALGVLSLIGLAVILGSDALAKLRTAAHRIV